MVEPIVKAVFFWHLIQRICRFPNLRLLDFRKIKVAHRKEANDLFKSKRGKELLKEIAKRTKTGQPGSSLESNGTNGISRFYDFVTSSTLFCFSNLISQSPVHLQLKLLRSVKRSKQPIHCRKWNDLLEYYKLVVRSQMKC